MVMRIPSSKDSSPTPSPHRLSGPHCRASHSPSSRSSSPFDNVKRASQDASTAQSASPSSAVDPAHIQMMLAARHSATSPSPTVSAFRRPPHLSLHHHATHNHDDHDDNENSPPSFLSNPLAKTPQSATSFLRPKPEPLSKRLASSSSSSLGQTSSIKSLRRSTGLLNLDDATNAPVFTLTSSSSSSSSSVKSPINSSPSVSSISSRSSATSFNSDYSSESLKYPKPRSQKPRVAPNHSLPQKRSLSSNTIAETPSKSPPRSLHWGEYNKALNSSSTISKTPFFKQPYFSKESLASPFQGFAQNNSSSATITTEPLHVFPTPTSSIPTSTGAPYKVRKTNPQSSVHTQLHSTPKLPHPVHPLAFSHSLTSSPSSSPVPEKKIKSARFHSPNTNLSSTSSFTNLSSVLTDQPKLSFKTNPSLDMEITPFPSLPSTTPTNTTTEDFKFAKPLQTAFMSTGLLSKRNRRRSGKSGADGAEPHEEDIPRYAPPETPCKKTGIIPKFGSQYSPFVGGISKFSTSFGSSSSSEPLGHSSPFHFDFNPDLPSTPTKRELNVPQSATSSSFGTTDVSWSHSTESPNTSFSSSIFQTSPFNKASKQASTASTITPSTYLVRSITPTSKEHVPPHTPDPILRHEMIPPKLTIEGEEPPRTPAKITTPLRNWTGPTLDADGDLAMGSVPEENHISPVLPSPMPSDFLSSELSSFLAPHSHQYIQKHMVPHPPMRSHIFRETETDPVLRGRFSSVSLIGRGQFSYVYVVAGQKPATQEFDNNSTRYAIKKTRHPYSGAKERNRCLEEVEILKKLTKPREGSEQEEEGREYIVAMLDSWEYNGHLYIMMEYCENGSLDAFLDENGNIERLDEWRVWKILVEIALGLRYIHSSGFLHLDIKPANIFITFEGSLKIGDFGMATKYPVPHGVEREGDREYIAPEILNRQMYGTPADIFSLGIMMVEIAANIVLPDNGIHWQKLRSGDLSDAGRLSSGNLLYTSDDDMNDDDDDDDDEEGDVFAPHQNGLLSPKYPPETTLHTLAGPSIVSSRSSAGSSSSSSAGCVSSGSNGSNNSNSRHSSSSSNVTSLASMNSGGDRIQPLSVPSYPRSSGGPALTPTSATSASRKRCRHRAEMAMAACAPGHGPGRGSSASSRRPRVPYWAPKFMVDGTGALDHMVKWLLKPEPKNRPSAAEILETEELRYVEEHRKAGAVIYEGDYGPQPLGDGLNGDNPHDADDVDVNWR